MKGKKPNDVKTRRFQTCLFHLMEYTSLRKTREERKMKKSQTHTHTHTHTNLYLLYNYSNYNHNLKKNHIYGTTVVLA